MSSNAERARAWNQAHPDRHAASERRFRARHPEVGREYKQGLRVQAIAVLGGACCKCGFTDIRALEIDHINNDGCLDRKKRTRYSMWASIIKGASVGEFQLLCANCHQIKSYEEIWKPHGAEWGARRGRKQVAYAFIHS
jgi:5-methylcytosine-specific restriction endonuclease McrA